MCEGHFYIKTIMHHEKEIIRKTFQLMRIMHKNKNHERLRRDSICVGLHFIFTYMLILESQSEPLQQQQVQWETETIQRQPERIARLQTVSCFAHLSQTLWYYVCQWWSFLVCLMCRTCASRASTPSQIKTASEATAVIKVPVCPCVSYPPPPGLIPQLVTDAARTTTSRTS